MVILEVGADLVGQNASPDPWEGNTMKIRRLTIGHTITSALLLLALSACTTPVQDSKRIGISIVDPDTVSLIEDTEGSMQEINFNLLRPEAAANNLLTSANDLSGSAWLKGPGLTVQANAEPNLSRLTAQGASTYVGQRANASAAGSYSARAFLKGSGIVTLFVQRSGGDYALYARQNVSLTTAGALVTVTVNKPADGFNIQMGIGDVQSGEQVLAGQAELVAGNFDGNPPPPTPGGNNLLVEVSNFAAPIWGKGNVTVQSNVDGEFDQLTSYSIGYVNQRTNIKAAGSYTARVTLKGSGSAELFLQRGGGDYAQYIRQSLDLGPQAVQVSVTTQKPNDGFPMQFGIASIDKGDNIQASLSELVAGTSTPATITGVSLNANPSSVKVYQASLLQATVTGTGSFSSAVTLSVQPASATLTALPTGGYEFKAATPGTYSITATSSGDPSKTAMTSISVTDAPPPAPTITAVTLSANPPQVIVNQVAQLQITVSGSGAFSNAVSFSSSPAGGNISTGGNGPVFTSSTPGTYTITATSSADPSKFANTNVTVATSIPSTSLGAWSGVLPLPVPPIHAGLLTNGKVIFWAYDEDSSTNTNKRTQTFLWNPVLNDTPVRIDNNNSKLFCSGHSFLPDGRLLTIGGLIRPTPPGTPQLGTKDTNIFNPASSTWSKAADMNIARYYPTSVPLANGDVLAVAGSNDTNGANLDTSEVWQTNSGLSETDAGRYRILSNAKFSQGWYPMAFQAPNGKVFNVGPQPTMGYLDTAGTGTWTSLGNRVDPANNNGNGQRTFGNAVMYEPGKIVLIGGADPPTNTAMKIDINGSSPVVSQVGSMAAARRQHNATILADGTVLVTGGTSGAGFNNAAQSLLTTELWNPTTGQFKTLRSAATPRIYHSLALLLPDARVLSAGGDGSDAPSYPNAEVFTPPYLLNSDGTSATRPSIQSAPNNINYNSSFAVGSSADVTRVSLVKLSSVTHSMNFDQRFLNLSFTKTANGLNVNAPLSGNVAPPGYYMLFVLNLNGVPSTAKMIKLN
jgi:Domain of unknown function (DUF1929)